MINHVLTIKPWNPIDLQNSFISIFGPRNSGKTTLTKDILTNLTGKIVCLEYGLKTHYHNNKNNNIPVSSLKNLKEILDMVRRKQVNQVQSFSDFIEHKLFTDSNVVSKLTLVLENISRIPKALECPELLKLINNRKYYNLNIIMVERIPIKLNYEPDYTITLGEKLFFNQLLKYHFSEFSRNNLEKVMKAVCKNHTALIKNSNSYYFYSTNLNDIKHNYVMISESD
jgi:AAA+ ATPase superfamily predicted ATPase